MERTYLTGELLIRAVHEKDTWINKDMSERPHFYAVNNPDIRVTFTFDTGSIGLYSINTGKIENFPAQMKWKQAPCEITLKEAWSKNGNIKPAILPCFKNQRYMNELNKYQDKSAICILLGEILKEGFVDEYLQLVNGKWFIENNEDHYEFARRFVENLPDWKKEIYKSNYSSNCPCSCSKKDNDNHICCKHNIKPEV